MGKQGVMNYTRTFQNTSVIFGCIPFSISQRSINAAMYGHNSLHPFPHHTLRRDQPLLNRFAQRLGSSRHIQFLIDVGEVEVDGTLADEEA